MTMISRKLFSTIPRLPPALLAVLVMAANAGANAQPDRGARLKVGDPAPALQTGKWIQGEAVKQFDRDHAYLIEFWATWCGPCKAAIPHVNELHRKFKDQGFVVIGQDVWETSEAGAAKLVKKMGDKMSYRVALDDKSDGGKGRMAKSWLSAAGLKSIPASFLVDKQGNIVWIGHPMELEESMIEAVLAGKFDAKQAVASKKAHNEAQARISVLTREAFTAIRAKDWEKAESAIEALKKALPKNQRYRAGSMRVTLLLTRGEQIEAANLAEKVAKEHRNNVFAQNILASQLVRTPEAQPAVLDAAERIASMGNAALEGNNISSLITLARVAFLKGDQAKAVEYQTRAVELSKPRAKPRMQQFLDSYKAGKLPDGRASRGKPPVRRRTPSTAKDPAK